MRQGRVMVPANCTLVNGLSNFGIIHYQLWVFEVGHPTV